MKCLLLLTTLAGFAGTVILFAGCGEKPAPKAPITVVFFGDSITTGYGVDPDQSWAGIATRILSSGVYGDVRTVNAGLNGDDTTEALGRFDTDVLAHRPDVVVIFFGLNDVQNRGLDAAQFTANIAAMLDRLPSTATPILVTTSTLLPSGGTDWQDMNKRLDVYMDGIRTLARQRNVLLADVNAAWEHRILGDRSAIESLYVDPMHPSLVGHRLIYDTIMNVLRRQLVR